MELRYLKNVATLRLDVKKCTGCGVCAEVCPHAVFKIMDPQAGDRKARIADLDRCMECGACARNCAFGAVSVNAGVGCAAAIIYGRLRGTEPSCGCGGTEKACCG
jgi:NAD-dependent dihydropyrimidine dehydrogenase PreA subunit